MHLFRSHGDRKGMFRGHAYFDLPTNPICWLVGHKARVEVVEPKYSDPWLLIECRVCGLRYNNPDGEAAIDHLPTRERGPARKEQQARRVEVARRDPKMVARSASGREGYGHHRLELSVELVRHKPKQILENLGFRIHTGGRGSETPLDAAVYAGLGSAYVSVGGVGGRLFEWLGRGHKREISIKTHGGQVWWNLWYDDDGGNDRYHDCDSWRQPKLWPWSAGRRKHRGWMCLRDGNLHLNPFDALWGTPSYLRTRVDGPRTALVVVGDFERDEYLVEFMLERFEVRREHGPAFARRVLRTGFHYEAKCKPGIPVRNHEWKGDEILGWGGPVLAPNGEPSDRWLQQAVAHTIELVRKDRRHYGYQPRKAVQS